ncbi:hypothetical protein [Methanobrevibacter sp.]|uniref:hypothetical protein n=1 Tax=Methanobrevibacter sp. TaxID=66852 RepID=UPI002E7A91DE|nr:hypothetical protein [Methanobrevibacter sp.]MEE0938222.1 hypothetical protein [Methanobrevibacter sp.]
MASPQVCIESCTHVTFNFKEIANKHKRSEWNENEKFILDKIAQDVFCMSEKQKYFNHDHILTRQY